VISRATATIRAFLFPVHFDFNFFLCSCNKRRAHNFLISISSCAAATITELTSSQLLRTLVLWADNSTSVASMRASCNTCSLTSMETGAYGRTPDKRSPQIGLHGTPNASHSSICKQTWYHRLCTSSSHLLVMNAAILTAACTVILVGVTWSKTDLLNISDKPTACRLEPPVSYLEKGDEESSAVSHHKAHHDERPVPALITYEGIEPVRDKILLSWLCFFCDHNVLKS
jgi:hypothetical protein